MVKGKFMEKLLNGAEVEWKPLGEVAELITTGKLNANAMEDDGVYPFFTCNETPFKINNYAFDLEAIIISGNGSQVGHLNYFKGKFNAYQRTYVIADFKAGIKIMYLLHYLRHTLRGYIIKNSRKGSVPYITMPMLEDFEIPIPPLHVQEEIVRILDTFTQLTAELTTQLTAELTARKKQYNYYREKLLTFEDGAVEWKRLGQVVNIKNGKDWKKLGIGDIPVYGSGGIMAYVDKFAYNKPTVLIPRKGSITNIFYVETPIWNVDTIYYTEIDISQLMPKFFYYYMKIIDLTKLDTGSGRPSLTQAILNEIPIPIPLLSEQTRIVSILDKFDTLCNDITQGLPHEINLRQKQYEYYRNMLLTFK